MFNILSYLYEMETGESYTMKKAHDVYSGIGDSELDQGSSAENQSEVSLPKIVELHDDDEEEQTGDSNQESEAKASSRYTKC